MNIQKLDEAKPVIRDPYFDNDEGKIDNILEPKG